MAGFAFSSPLPLLDHKLYITTIPNEYSLKYTGAIIILLLFHELFLGSSIITKAIQIYLKGKKDTLKGQYLMKSWIMCSVISYSKIYVHPLSLALTLVNNVAL